MLNIWIGYDKQFGANIGPELDSIAHHSKDVKINLLRLDKLPMLTRPREATQSTDSAFTRWLIPYLGNYTGWHLYLDSDMLVCKDLELLWNMRDESKAVMVVKHNHSTGVTTKFNNMTQTYYTRKNWSSLIMFNASLCKQLTPEYVNTAPGLDLHQFRWLEDEQIGSLPNEWNHLVGVDAPNADPAIVHWTLGGPWFAEHASAEHADKWLSYSTN